MILYAGFERRANTDLDQNNSLMSPSALSNLNNWLQPAKLLSSCKALSVLIFQSVAISFSLSASYGACLASLVTMYAFFSAFGMSPDLKLKVSFQALFLIWVEWYWALSEWLITCDPALPRLSARECGCPCGGCCWWRLRSWWWRSSLSHICLASKFVSANRLLGQSYLPLSERDGTWSVSGQKSALKSFSLMVEVVTVQLECVWVLLWRLTENLGCWEL